MTDEINSLTELIREFAEKRDWGKFHIPKNLAMAVAGEAGEPVAEFQWLTPEESSKESPSDEMAHAIAMEIADVQIYLLRLADVLGVDISKVVRDKIDYNETRY